MALRHFLYRCPRCGHDPTTGEGDRVLCPGCGAEFERGGQGARIVVRSASGAREEEPAWELAEALNERGGALAAAGAARGEVEPSHRSEAVASRILAEEPVWFQGRLTGFCERLGEGEPGVLHLDGDRLSFQYDGGRSEEWPILEIRAVQTSSKSIQVILPGGALRQFEFIRDSPLRWEQLLHGVIRRRWREAGRGEITEFQPRISSR